METVLDLLGKLARAVAWLASSVYHIYADGNWIQRIALTILLIVLFHLLTRHGPRRSNRYLRVRIETAQGNYEGEFRSAGQKGNFEPFYDPDDDAFVYDEPLPRRQLVLPTRSGPALPPYGWDREDRYCDSCDRKRPNLVRMPIGAGRYADLCSECRSTMVGTILASSSVPAGRALELCEGCFDFCEDVKIFVFPDTGEHARYCASCRSPFRRLA